MSIEAMKQALEALDVATTPLAKDRQEVLRAKEALRQAIEQAEKQEPVACPYPCGWDNLFSIIIKKGAYLSTSTIDDEKPLSDHQRQEMMSMIDYARTLASWGKSTRPQTAPQKKEWVGLTDEEAKKVFGEHNCVISADLAGILARAIEAKLKEKNCSAVNNS
jgi:hypothetical protein